MNCALFLLVLVTSLGVCDACINTYCMNGYYPKEGSIICCKKCPAGSKVERDCTSNPDDTLCVSCSEGYFTSNLNGEKHCKPRDSCSKHHESIDVAAKDSTEDNICKCDRGYHYSSTGELCLSNLSCPPGQGVKRGRCVVCEDGSYSDIESDTQKCKPQPECEFIKLEGNTTYRRECSDVAIVQSTSTILPTEMPHIITDTLEVTTIKIIATSSEDGLTSIQSPTFAEHYGFNPGVKVLLVVLGIFLLIGGIVCAICYWKLKKRNKSYLKEPSFHQQDVYNEEREVPVPDNPTIVTVGDDQTVDDSNQTADSSTGTSSETTTPANAPLLRNRLSSSSSLSSDEGEVAMKNKHIDILRGLKPLFASDLPLEAVLGEMPDVFSLEDEAWINQTSLDVYARRRRFIDRLVTKGPNAYERFVEVLDKVCKHLAEAVRNNESSV